MITFKQFISESITDLYKQVNAKTANALAANQSVPVKKKFTSFVKDPKHLKSEFGDTTIKCMVKDLPANVQVIEIQYDLA